MLKAQTEDMDQQGDSQTSAVLLQWGFLSTDWEVLEKMNFWSQYAFEMRICGFQSWS